MHTYSKMSYCKREGKDVSVFVTKEDASKPEVLTTLVQEEEYGILLPSGEINWDCPCLGGMADGPCGQEFKDSFSCFHYSTEEEKGSDCIPQFRAMQECFQKYPEVYSRYDEEEEEEEETANAESESSSEQTSAISDSSSGSEPSGLSTGLGQNHALTVKQ